MKQLLIFSIFFYFSTISFAQDATSEPGKRRFSIKSGYNIARVSGQSADFKPSTKNGFMVAASFSAGGGNGMGFKTEIVFSRQGFGFSSNGINSTVQSDYIYVPQLSTFTIANKVQLQLGGQIGYLLQSSQQENKEGNQQPDFSELMNRFDYGAAAGLEVYPFKGLILGGRYNISFGNTFSSPSPGSLGNPLPFNPSDLKSRNAVVNFFIGYRF